MESFPLNPELEARWAKEKAGGIQSRELRWRHALQVFQQLPWPKEPAAKILEAANEPDQLEALAGFMAQEERVDAATVSGLVQDWLNRVDDTALPLKDWLESYAVLQRYLQSEGRKTSFTLASGFIACSEEAAGMGYGFGRLPDVVLQMLKEYGFEG